MKRLFFLIMSLPLLTRSQETGIHFEDKLAWEQVKAKALAEKKYIFVDCYATWCGPCKVMDEKVYSLPSVGAVVNSKFIAVKIQMDKTDKDNETVKSWYPQADNIQAQYKLAGYPSYLFFSPEGKLLHKAIGAMPEDAFIKLVKEAADPSMQAYTLLENYKEGKKDYERMAKLAEIARNYGEQDLSNAIAKDYKDNYLDKLSEDELCKKEILDFVNNFGGIVYYPEGSKSRFFKLFYKSPEKVDKLTRQGFADFFVKNTITKEEITDKLWIDKDMSTVADVTTIKMWKQKSRLWKTKKPVTFKPDWKIITASINKKYGSNYASKVVFPAQLQFYKSIEDWNEFVKLFELKIKTTPPTSGNTGQYSSMGDSWGLNGEAWYLFQHCDDKKALAKALEWSELSIKLEQPTPNVQYLDTKANLLYKLGRVKEAIECEEQAIEMDRLSAKKNGREKGFFFDEYRSVIEKMKNDIPTWRVREGVK